MAGFTSAVPGGKTLPRHSVSQNQFGAVGSSAVDISVHCSIIDRTIVLVICIFKWRQEGDRKECPLMVTIPNKLLLTVCLTSFSRRQSTESNAQKSALSLLTFRSVSRVRVAAYLL